MAAPIVMHHLWGSGITQIMSGEYVAVKINAAEILEKEISKLPKDKQPSILLSSVTDPYQGLESKYKITRKCLEVLAKAKYKGQVSILTKSPLVLRDIDLFKKLENAEIGMTVTTTEDPLGILIEKLAPPSDKRIDALAKLHKEGIKTYAFVGPLLPHFVLEEKNLIKLFKRLEEAKVDYIYLEHLNLSPYIKKRLYPYVKEKLPEKSDLFKMAEDSNIRKNWRGSSTTFFLKQI